MPDPLEQAIDRYECVVFDFDGTLVDLKTDWDALRLALQSQFSDADFSRIGIGLDHVHAAHGVLGLSQAFETIHRYEVKNGWKLKPWTCNILKNCQSRHQRVGIFTANSTATVERILEWEGLRNLVSSIVGSDQVVNRKPDPSGLFLSLINLHASKENTVYVADGAHECQTASVAGLPYVAIESVEIHEFAA